MIRNDLAFDVYGYAFISLNNFFTAANGIYTKKKLDSMVHRNFINWNLISNKSFYFYLIKQMGEYDLLYYNALLTLFPMIFLSFYSGEIDKVRCFSKTLFK